MGLIQAELERRGVTTVSVTMLPEVTRKVRPPRALSVPFPMGFPLGLPGDAGAQTAVLRRMLSLCARRDVPVMDELGDERRSPV